MKPVDMVMFDLAGTTVQDQDGLVANVFMDVASTRGISTTAAEINSMRGRSKIEVFRFLISRQQGKAISHTEVEDPAQAAHADFQSRILAAYRRACPPVPGAVDAFRFLKEKGITVAVDKEAREILVQFRPDDPNATLPLALLIPELGGAPIVSPKPAFNPALQIYEIRFRDIEPGKYTIAFEPAG